MSSPATILVVDDNAPQRYSLCRALTEEGFIVVEVASGVEALLKAREPPDLVLLDVRLPDIDGLEVCRRLKADPSTSKIPVVMISANEQNGSVVTAALQLGALGFLFIPVKTSELVTVIRGSLARTSIR